MPMRAALYTRISEKDERVDKVDIQHQRLRDAAEREGYEVVEHFTDDGISAYSGKLRPGFQSLLLGIKAGRFDVVMAVAPDRFTRNTNENAALLLLCEGSGTILHTLTNGIIDASSPMSKGFAGIAGIFAEIESSEKVRRQRDRIDHELQNGRPLWGNRPYGFAVDRMAIVEEEAEHIRWAYEQGLAGATLYAIAKGLNERGSRTVKGHPWGYSSARRLMERPRNAGLLVSKGVQMPTSLIEPIVSVEIFEAYQNLARVPLRQEPRGPKVVKHVATGIARCGVCGSPMRSSTMILAGERVAAYKCATKTQGLNLGERHVSIAGPVLEAIIRDHIVSAFLNGEATSGRDGAAATRISEIRAVLADLATRREKVAEVYEMGGRTLEATKGKLGALLAAEKPLREELGALVSSSASEAMLDGVVSSFAVEVPGMVPLWMPDDLAVPAEWRRRIGADADALSARWDALAMEQRRELLRSLLRVTVRSGRTRARVEVEHVRAAARKVAPAWTDWARGLA